MNQRNNKLISLSLKSINKNEKKSLCQGRVPSVTSSGTPSFTTLATALPPLPVYFLHSIYPDLTSSPMWAG